MPFFTDCCKSSLEKSGKAMDVVNPFPSSAICWGALVTQDVSKTTFAESRFALSRGRKSSSRSTYSFTSFLHSHVALKAATGWHEVFTVQRDGTRWGASNLGATRRRDLGSGGTATRR